MSKEEEVKKILKEAEDCGLLTINDDKYGTVASDITQKIVNLFPPPPVVRDLRELKEKIAQHLYEKEFSAGYWNERMTVGDKSRWLNIADSILSVIKEAGYVKLSGVVTEEMIKSFKDAGWRKIK